MANTPTWSITYPTTANTITPLATHFANLANSTDTALTNLRNQQGSYIGTDAQRTALTAPTLREGIKWYSTDTNREWEYDGSSWISFDGGSYLIWPGSVVGATISADGAIIPNGSTTSFSVNGAFSARFRSYTLKYYFTLTANGQPFFRLRSAGSDFTTVGYVYQTIYGSGSTVGSGATSPAGFYSPSAYGFSYHVGTLDVVNPFITPAPKFFISNSTTAPTNAMSVAGGYVGNTADSMTFDGFTWYNVTFNSSANSWIKIYGNA